MTPGREARARGVRGRGGAAIVLAGVVVCGATVAAATTTSSGADTAISGCVLKSSGQLRVIDPAAGESCRSTERRISWSTGAEVPPLADGSVRGGPGGVVADDTLTGDDLAAGAVAGDELVDGAVTGPKLADGAVTGPKLADGAVTGAKLTDGAINHAKIARGAVTSDKVTANVSGASSVLTGLGSSPTTVSTATLDLASEHKVLVLGQAQLNCMCDTGEMVEVSWQLYDGETPIGASYGEQLSATDRRVVVSVSALVDHSTAGLHQYHLKVQATPDVPLPWPAATAGPAQVTALDLGR